MKIVPSAPEGIQVPWLAGLLSHQAHARDRALLERRHLDRRKIAPRCSFD
jgi:hypothetical protein